MQKKRIGGFWHRGSLEGPSIVEVSRVFVAASEKFKKELQAILCSDPVRVCGEVPPAGLLSRTPAPEGVFLMPPAGLAQAYGSPSSQIPVLNMAPTVPYLLKFAISLK